MQYFSIKMSEKTCQTFLSSTVRLQDLPLFSKLRAVRHKTVARKIVETAQPIKIITVEQKQRDRVRLLPQYQPASTNRHLIFATYANPPIRNPSRALSLCQSVDLSTSQVI